MKIFWPLPNFPGFPDFGLESSTCLEIIGALKRIQFYNGSKSFKQQLILIKINVKGGNLIHFTCSHERWLYYYHLKSGTKWYEENNRVGLFSTLFQNVILLVVDMWPMFNILIQLYIGTKKEAILWCGWLPRAHLKLIKLQTSQGPAGVCIDLCF